MRGKTKVYERKREERLRGYVKRSREGIAMELHIAPWYS
jgi:hypothetical protein